MQPSHLYAIDPNGPSEYAIAADGLSKSFGDRQAVQGLDLRVATGRVTGFVGPNGAGKTTTIRMLLRLIAPSSGHATVLGEPISGSGDYLRRVGALIEAPAFYPGLSGRGNLDVLRALGRIEPGRVDEVLTVVGLAERGADKVKDYSLGMKQRLAIGAALLSDPELLILDEPTNGLDPAGIREIRALLRQIAERGVGILVSSHLLSEIQAICEDLVMIRDGEVIYQGSVERLLRSQPGRLVLRPERPAQLDALSSLLTGLGHPVVMEDETVVVDAGTDAAAEINRRAFGEGIVLAEISVDQASLEQAYFAIEDSDQAEVSA